jgi:lipopolysaccharide/colanic/teichoic acid biosynthesis glycosyltransferase
MYTNASDIQFSEFTIRPPRAQRVLDVLLAVSGLLVLFPLFAVIAILIRVDSGGPIFFRQKRVGLRGREFEIFKFRTMVVDAEKLGAQITVGRDPRISRIGAFLRKNKLDELPQLLNVVRGEMSIVGPRPEVPRYVALYSTEQRQILSVRPGITSPASIVFRNENDLLGNQEDPEHFYREEVMPAKIRLDLEYARRATLFSDLAMIARTVARILK